MTARRIFGLVMCNECDELMCLQELCKASMFCMDVMCAAGEKKRYTFPGE